MYVLVPYKNKEDQMVKMKALEWSHYTAIFRCSRAANSVVGGLVWPKSKLIEAYMVVFFTCQNEEDPFKYEGARLVTTDLLL